MTAEAPKLEQLRRAIRHDQRHAAWLRRLADSIVREYPTEPCGGQAVRFPSYVTEPDVEKVAELVRARVPHLAVRVRDWIGRKAIEIAQHEV